MGGRHPTVCAGPPAYGCRGTLAAPGKEKLLAGGGGGGGGGLPLGPNPATGWLPLRGRSSWPRTNWRSQRRPAAKVARHHLCISDTVRCPCSPSPSQNPSRTIAPTHMGVTDRTQSWHRSQDPHNEPLRCQEGGRCAWPNHNPLECPVMAIGQVVEVAVASASAPGPDGRYQIRYKGVYIRRFGSSQTLIHQRLVRPRPWWMRHG